MNSQDNSSFFHQQSNERYFRGGNDRRRSPNTTPASTVLNSPDLSTDINYLHHAPQHHHGGGDGIQHHHHHHHHQIKVGRSPVSQHDTESRNSCSPVGDDDDDDGDAQQAKGATASGSGDLMTASNSQVVFDDIGENWRKYPYPMDGSGEADSGSNKATKIIEYEGSPRRIGHQQSDLPGLSHRPSSKVLLTSPTLLLPRPGFPQRITSSANSNGYARYNQEQSSQHSHLHQSPAPPSDSPFTGTNNDLNCLATAKNGPFDYLYEFSETRKVLEDFFKSPEEDPRIDFTTDSENGYDNSYIGQRLSKMTSGNDYNDSPRTHYGYHHQNNHHLTEYENNEIELYLDSNSRSSGELADTELDHNIRGTSRHYTLSPESMDYDSNCGDLDSLSNDIHCNIIGGVVGTGGGNGIGTDYARLYTSMPILEDGLSSGHASDTENNNPNLVVLPISIDDQINHSAQLEQSGMAVDELIDGCARFENKQRKTEPMNENAGGNDLECRSARGGCAGDVEATLRDIRTTLQRTKTLLGTQEVNKTQNSVDKDKSSSPVWVPRNLNASLESVNSENVIKPLSPDDEEADTDLETDRLLGQQRLDDQGFTDEKPSWCDRSTTATTLSGTPLPVPTQFSSATIRHGIGTALTPLSSPHAEAAAAITGTPIGGNSVSITGQIDGSSSSSNKDNNTSPNKKRSPSITSTKSKDNDDKKELTRNKEGRWKPSVLIEGVLFRARYLGSTQLVCEGQPTKSTRMIQAEEAVSRIKAPPGESQPSTEVDLFISTEKIMVLNTDLKEIMMDHALRTISYIADIGDLVVLMARRRFIPQENDDAPKPNRTPKMICHVFESDEAQFIAQSIGQAFQVAYMEFLKANGIEDHSFVKEMDYQEVLNSQEIFGDELEIFAKKELQKEVVVPKVKGEILGVVIVESGWGSMLPTVVIANLLSTGAAARCGQLNIGDQIIAINGLSLVGLPLSTCQSYIRNTKTQTAVKFTVVPCPPVVEVKIKRPNTKYQLGFSVQNGVICSLLRGGIAERGGVRVGHRIIEINNQSVVAVPHEKIVSLLATSVGEILMKTMPTSMFRLLTGQENPLYI